MPHTMSLQNKDVNFMEAKELMQKAVELLDKKKAVDLKALALGELTVVADYFVIATGTSGTHIRALADELEEAMSALGVEPGHIEGKATGWILLDYGSVVVHIFTPDSRDYFNLERLWSDAEDVDLSAIVTE